MSDSTPTPPASTESSATSDGTNVKRFGGGQSRPGRRPEPRRSIRHPYSAQERARIREDLHIDGDERWKFRFGLLLGLSLVIAVMGLSANSSAVVIGAMLVAPLMSPVLALAYSIATGWPRRIFQSFSTVVLASLGCVGLAALLAWILPDYPPSTEILARTQPDIRDLLVALAAGTAGSYATLRESNSSLPGVAVAVALVPPLATIGICLQQGLPTLAIGATLLYLANLAAIVLSGVAVMIGSGFVTWRRVTQVGRRVGLGAGLSAIAVSAVGIPLFLNSFDSLDAAQEEARIKSEVQTTVEGWLADSPGIEARSTEVDFDQNFVVVSLTGTGDAPAGRDLAGLLLPTLGDDVSVIVRQVEVASDGQTEQAESDEEVERIGLAVSDAVQTWLATRRSPEDGTTFEVTNVLLTEGVVEVQVAGSESPPVADDALLSVVSGIDMTRTLALRWVPTAVATRDDVPDNEALARQIIDEWVSERDYLTVDRVMLDEGPPLVVIADFSGSQRPDGLAELDDQVRDQFGDEAELVPSLALRVPLEIAPPTLLIDDDEAAPDDPAEAPEDTDEASDSAATTSVPSPSTSIAGPSTTDGA